MMYDRMLDKSTEPTVSEMTAYCGKTAGWFSDLNAWLSEACGTEQKIVFPYGNQYGWGISHRVRQRLVCNVFPEDQSFTVMMRLSNAQFASVYPRVCAYTKNCIDHKYHCGSGGWIHYRISEAQHCEDIRTLLSIAWRKA